MEYYQMSITEIMEKLNTSHQGLDDNGVNISREKYGINKIQGEKEKSLLIIFLSQYKDILVIILIISSIVSFFTNDIVSGIVILSVITLNAFIGTVQYVKAKKTLVALKKMTQKETRVLRSNKIIDIKETEVVVGDILLLSPGDILVSDARVITDDSIVVDESHLTGEANCIYKTNRIIENKSPINEQTNMLFSGSKVLQGKAKAIVVGVGIDSEIGKIAKMMDEAKADKTPLEKSLNDLSVKIATVILLVCAIVFLLNIIQGKNIIESGLFAIALAVAAIPEALSTVVVICLAIGVMKLANNNALVKNLKKVETLGSVSVICSDKTGTITRNEMAVTEYYTKKEKELFEALIIANEGIDSKEGIIASPVDKALLEYAKRKVEVDYELISVIPFNSENKKMSALVMKDKQKITYKKGAYEYLKKEIIYYDNHLLNYHNQLEIENKIKEMADKGLKVICYTKGVAEQEFLGLVGLMDLPREGIKEAVEDCYKSKIKVMMITGDNKDTAVAIAKKVGINSDSVLTDISKLSNSELDLKVKNTFVYARMLPSDKLRLVEALKRNGEIVAMTGDGINDAPAIKKCDVGIAMGSGTEVAKDASDVVLLDNDFKTIYKAVQNGRNIYANIRNVICFLIAGNMGCIIASLYSSIMNMPFPFLPIHLLFINLLTDSLPAIAIGMDEASHVNKSPRKKNEKIINGKNLLKITLEGLLIGGVTIMAYYLSLKTQHVSMCFLVLCLARLFFGFNTREENVLFIDKIKNKWLLFSCLLGLILVNLIMFVPVLRNIFFVDIFSVKEVITIYFLALFPTFVIQTYYTVRRVKLD